MPRSCALLLDYSVGRGEGGAASVTAVMTDDTVEHEHLLDGRYTFIIGAIDPGHRYRERSRHRRVLETDGVSRKVLRGPLELEFPDFNWCGLTKPPALEFDSTLNPVCDIQWTVRAWVP